MSLFVRGLVVSSLVLGCGVARAESAAPAPVRVYMRSDGEPLTFSAREASSSGAPTWCVTPCNAALAPGKYDLKLNGVSAGDRLSVKQPGTFRGELHSRAASRAGGWLALNVGGIIGGVFLTVGALGGPSWAYFAGGGSLLGGGAIFLLTYRSDSATVSFSPSEPLDVKGMPLSPEQSAKGAALGEPARFGSVPRGLGFRVAF